MAAMNAYPEPADRRAPAELQEHAIAMFKPDALDAGVADAIVDELVADGFVIVARRSHRLTIEEAGRHALHPTAEYLEFLCSRPVEFLLLRAVSPFERLYRFKKALRARHGVATSPRNLLHISDDGNEYHALLASFFAERDPVGHCNLLDLDAVVSPAELDALAARGRPRVLGVRLGGEHDRELASGIRSGRWPRLRLFATVRASTADGERVLIALPPRQFELGAPRAVAGVDPLAGARAVGGVAYLAEVSADPEQLDRYRQLTWTHKLSGADAERDRRLVALSSHAVVARLAARGLRGLLCFRPGLTLLETELRMDLARLAGIHRGGASCGLTAPGRFAVSIASLSRSPVQALLDADPESGVSR